MDLTQRKLSKQEWNNIEIPVSDKEKSIITMICKGFTNKNIVNNTTLSLLSYLKISSTKSIDCYVFNKYIYPELKNIISSYDLPEIENDKKKTPVIKKADMIRFSNTDKNLSLHRQNLFEFVILDLFKKMHQDKKKPDNENKYRWQHHYYSIYNIMKNDIANINPIFVKYISNNLLSLEKDVNINELVMSGHDIIERNNLLLKYADETLYSHQKTLFTLCDSTNPKLISYIAPTGTGKTLSPIGLSEKYKIIFVCAARHVGLALAKAAISVEKKVAFAFGCEDANDIRLHYFSATDYIRNNKSGRIAKVDNSVGDKVEIMICDIKSYITAMHYMVAFNDKNNIIMYWDEPTITLDYETHDCHDIIHKNWSENTIPNVVLSSATLPCEKDLQDTISDFKSRFSGADYHSIVSYDCKKTIPLINKEGFVEMPHYLCKTHEDVVNMASHCRTYKTLLRYIDLKEAIKFISYVNGANGLCVDRYRINSSFTHISDVTMINIKLYYISLIGNIDKTKWSEIYQHMQKTRTKFHNSNIFITTNDAITLTDGPTIFLSNDVEKIAKFCLHSAKIPSMVLRDLESSIKQNDNVMKKVENLSKLLEEGTKKDQDKEKKIESGRMDPAMKQLTIKIQELQADIKTISLHPMFIPNSREHIERYHDLSKNIKESNPFTSDITESTVERIMQLTDIQDSWKLLLLMGIGVFTSYNSIKYMEIMKELAQSQKLYLIIASTDFIYGTNYQFCHGYISKDLCEMSQEKCIQAMGRVGRNKLQQNYTFRFRDNALIHKLFTKEENKPEVKNMAILFNSDKL